MIRGEIQDVSVAALELAVTRGKVDLSLLKIFCEQEVELDGGYVLRAAIIGTSHFVQLRKSSLCLTEMLACDADNDFGGEKLISRPILSVKNGFDFTCDELSYSFTHKEQSYSDSYKQLTSSWEAKIETEPLIHMAYEFNKHGNLPSARTLLAVEKEGKELRIFTAHEYQEENKVVLSESLISIHG